MKIGILGTGAYGIALALAFLEKKNSVCLWTKFEKEANMLRQKRENRQTLPGVFLPQEISVTTSLEKVCQDTDILVIAIPAEFVCLVSKEMQPFLKNQIILLASKGMEQETCLFLHEVLAKHHDTSRLCVMAGGTFAKDIVKKVPIGLTLASKNEKAIEMVRLALENESFHFQITDDISGVELCSSIKNVIALAAGILEGLGASESTKSMFLTKSFQDIRALLTIFGCDSETIFSFAGIGDFILTCTNHTSRNFSFGKIFVTGTSEEIEAYQASHTIEGLYTLKTFHQLLGKRKISIEIIELLYQILYQQEDAKKLLSF